MGKLLQQELGHDMQPIPLEELAVVIGNNKRAQRYGSMARGVFQEMGLDSLQGPIKSKRLIADLEKKLATLLSSMGLAIPTNPLSYPNEIDRELVQTTLAGVKAGKTLAERTAWIHSALVTSGVLYNNREEVRGYVSTPNPLREEYCELAS